mgnify:CR=1 FL=1
MNNLIKISKLAKELGISKVTLYNWKNKGKVEFVKSPTGRNHVTREVYNSLLNIKEIKDDKTVIYCRVSSTINKTNLDSGSYRKVVTLPPTFNKPYDLLLYTTIKVFGNEVLGLNDCSLNLPLRYFELRDNYPKSIEFWYNQSNKPKIESKILT